MLKYFSPEKEIKCSVVGGSRGGLCALSAAVRIDDVILGRKFSFLYVVITGYLVITLLQLTLSYLQFYCNNRVNNRVTLRILYYVIDCITRKK